MAATALDPGVRRWAARKRAQLGSSKARCPVCLYECKLKPTMGLLGLGARADVWLKGMMWFTQWETQREC